jgi:hypothetical protein
MEGRFLLQGTPSGSSELQLISKLVKWNLHGNNTRRTYSYLPPGVIADWFQHCHNLTRQPVLKRSAVVSFPYFQRDCLSCFSNLFNPFLWKSLSSRSYKSLAISLLSFARLAQLKVAKIFWPYRLSVTNPWKSQGWVYKSWWMFSLPTKIYATADNSGKWMAALQMPCQRIDPRY